ncbi:unnamed protein product [Tuber melanosporum]|uniref:(Perigord truffle) hypothetical protein n=1 Tax=Tuber melanosporum (strain Mel28) TaxID=656061 RepID=D5GN34_TUBMM|nr:uncharacterized protein GSTUM_00011068001 [Tuber melanosporum]CAZ85927.1 unnamed protein product [Tuber melanosporum]
MSPDPKIRRIRKRVFELLELTSFSATRDLMATDYAKTIITARKLEIADDKLQVEVRYFDADQAGPHEKSKVYAVTITLVQLLEPNSLKDYVNGLDPDFDSSPAIQALNIILAKPPSQNAGVIPLGKSKFFVSEPNPQNQQHLPRGLLALRGYYSSIRPSMGRVLCNVNVCMTAFYKEGNLAELMREFGKRSELGGFLRGLRVSTKHITDPNGKPKLQYKTIANLTGKSAREATFVSDDGSTITVAAYFKKKYNIVLANPDFPCVNVGTREKSILLPPELATVLPGQSFKGKLLDEQTREMITYACRRPRQNAESIVGEGLSILGLKPSSQLLNPFNLSVSTEMVTVPARILAAPPVQYAGGPKTTSDASWNLRDVRFLKSGSAKTWAAIILKDGSSNVQDPLGLCNALQSMCRKCGVVLPPLTNRDISVVQMAMGQELATKLTPCFDALKKRGVQIALVILPSQDKANYALIKTLGDVRFGVGTVCAQSSKIQNQKGQMQYFANLALKFNLKLHGRNHGLGKTDMGFLTQKTTMIVGCDVTHPSPGSLRGTPSIAGVVASIDMEYAQYPASLRLQESKKEMITELREMMVERLSLWRDKNSGRLPEAILVYRDGVSEGQFKTVLDAELPKIREACVVMRADYRPKVTIIIVGKRHHTRFYPTESDKADRLGNPAPGTIVDRGVTAVYDYDFYLQAHAGLQGTTRPAHYYVIHDKNGFDADSLQTLTHNLCYLFGRATKSVSICPPAYYADLVCERGRCYIYGLLNASDSGSVKSTNSEDEAKANYAKAVQMWSGGPHADIRQTMYYL